MIGSILSPGLVNNSNGIGFSVYKEVTIQDIPIENKFKNWGQYAPANAIYGNPIFDKPIVDVASESEFPIANTVSPIKLGSNLAKVDIVFNMSTSISIITYYHIILTTIDKSDIAVNPGGSYPFFKSFCVI